MDANGFRDNHYVPEWYQRRFLSGGKHKYWYLDLHPETVTSGTHTYVKKALRERGPDSCFKQLDLYTTFFGQRHNVDIEKIFFGRVDDRGKAALELFSGLTFDKPEVPRAFNDLVRFMSIQKLRTPKGLGWLKHHTATRDTNHRLMKMQELQNLYCAIFSECVWQIADAENSNTKFIISDHPVTAYNRYAIPESTLCKHFNDPDARMVATHTYFPLSLNQILIMTNLAWVRNPYQDEKRLRPNPVHFRNTLQYLLDIQIYRSLSEQEVLQINYITKKRALRFIAGANADWLYPEKYLPSTDWSTFGGGYLFMPEPRLIHLGGTTSVGYGDGRVETMSEYGYRPSQAGFSDKRLADKESNALRRFKAEWATRQGPEFRGTPLKMAMQTGRPHVENEQIHQFHVAQASRPRKQR